MQINFELEPNKADIDQIHEGLVKFNVTHFGYDSVLDFGCFVRDDKGQIRGGATGYIAGEMAMVRLLWMDEALRGLGFASKLMTKLETQAKTRGVTEIHLDTYSFQAPGFYKKLGFKEVARYVAMKNKNIEKIFFIKEL